MSRAWAGGSTRAWRRVRALVLERDHWVCQLRLVCQGDRATEVDHVVPLGEGGDLLDPANGRASCARCNRVRGGRQAHRVPVPRRWSW